MTTRRRKTARERPQCPRCKQPAPFLSQGDFAACPNCYIEEFGEWQTEDICGHGNDANHVPCEQCAEWDAQRGPHVYDRPEAAGRREAVSVNDVACSVCGDWRASYLQYCITCDPCVAVRNSELAALRRVADAARALVECEETSYRRPVKALRDALAALDDKGER